MNKTSTATLSSPFISSNASVGKVMRLVIYAMIPGIVLYINLFGWGGLINIFLATTSTLIFEWVMLLLRDRPVRIFLFDGSAVVTAFLLALAIPPMVSWWIPVTGSFFAIVVAKHLYGGLGYNTFNPAMAAYAVLLISFPLELSLWSAPLSQLPQTLSLIDAINYSFYKTLPVNISFDAMTSATLLDHIRTEVSLGNSIANINQSTSYGVLAGKGSEWISLGFLVGGLWLLYKKIISWHIPVAVLMSLMLIASISYLLNPSLFANPAVHIFGGASILGAFFIATDPVTASTTPKGRFIYGIGIGILTFSIRTWGGYPDGIAFAVLLMGMTVPIIDHYTTPKVYGARKLQD